jgi:hypothetical protein
MDFILTNIYYLFILITLEVLFSFEGKAPGILMDIRSNISFVKVTKKFRKSNKNRKRKNI